MIPPLQLREWTKTSVEELTPAQISELQRIDGLRIEPRPDGRFDITPTGNLVGYVRRGETSVIIRPSKCDSGLVLFMMGYTDNPEMFGESQVDFEADEDLLEATVSVFVRATLSSVARGLYRAYASMDEELSVIRGRVRISDQISRRFRLVPPISVSYDEFTVDVIENRLIKAALEVVSQMPIRNKRTVDDLQVLRAVFTDVTHTDFDQSSMPKPVWTRLNQHLKYSVNLAKRIILHSSISLDLGDSSSDEFLINMANVFEDFVVTAIREELNLNSTQMPRANELRNNPYLDLGNLIKLKPDISRWQGSQCVAIGDVKYKRTSSEGVVHPDVYQLLAYATATELCRASVVYACGKGERDELLVGSHKVRGIDIEIEVFALDLTKSSSEVLDQIAEFARAFQPRLPVC
jgi:5-methylcytosine-specific restriction enzyme subunit McrC